MDSKICTFVNTLELDVEIQKIIKELQIVSIIRTSEFENTGSEGGSYANYIIIYK